MGYNEEKKKSSEITTEVEIPVRGTVSKTYVNFPDEASAGTIDESMLSDEEKQKVDEYADEINIEDVDSIIHYGEKAQENISTFSVNILRKVRTLDLGDMGESLKELTVALDATVVPEKHGVMRFFQKTKQNFDALKANYVKAETNVDKIEKDLQTHRSILTQDISMYQDMYDLNKKYYKELTLYIIAGKKALDKARNIKITALRKKAENTQKQEDAQELRDFEDQCARFEKKLNDMELTRMISIQTAPQVRMLQNNDREMLDKIQSSLVNTIPLWRNQLVLSLGIEHSRRAVEAETQLSDKTNALLKQNAATLRMATIETARESERPVVDIETLQQCNRDLIESINDVVRIHAQGAQKRVEAHDKLLQLESELKQALLQQNT